MTVRFLASPRRLAIAALGAAALSVISAPPARAGHWVVDMNGSSSGYYNTYTITNNVASPTPPPEGYGVGPYFTTESQGEQVMNGRILADTAVSSLAVQATFNWIQDGQSPTTPPSSVTVLETGQAYTDALDSGANSELMQASDGLTSLPSGDPLLDPAVFNNAAVSSAPVENRAFEVFSGGDYVTVGVPVAPGSTSFTLPVRTLSVGTDTALVGQGSLGNGGFMTYSAAIDTAPDYVITVSNAGESPGGNSTSTVTVQSVNGFVGTVSLNLVGMINTGALPPLPAGGAATGGYTVVQYQSGNPMGSPVTNGPTDAQLAARVSGTFSPTSVTLTANGSATSTLTLTSNAAGAVGTYPIEVQGTYTNNGSSIFRDGLGSLTL